MISILANHRVEIRLYRHFADIFELGYQLCKTNFDIFTHTVGLDISNPADAGLHYPYRGLKQDLTGGLI